jgi:hypothetical protein
MVREAPNSPLRKCTGPNAVLAKANLPHYASVLLVGIVAALIPAIAEPGGKYLAKVQLQSFIGIAVGAIGFALKFA